MNEISNINVKMRIWKRRVGKDRIALEKKRGTDRQTTRERHAKNEKIDRQSMDKDSVHFISSLSVSDCLILL